MAAVSYTHLDVYKRQGFSGMKDQYLDVLEPDTIIHVSDRDSLIRFLNTTGCYHIATKNIKAVSYTHLFICLREAGSGQLRKKAELFMSRLWIGLPYSVLGMQ